MREEKRLKLWAVTNLGGKALIWDIGNSKGRMPIFTQKKFAVAEKAVMDIKKPSPNKDKFNRKVVQIFIKYKV